MEFPNPVSGRGPMGALRASLAVVADRRTYLNLLYLLLSFPLGTLYFVVLVVVLAAIVDVGAWTVVALVAFLPAVHGLATVEVVLTERLLGVDVPTPPVSLRERLWTGVVEVRSLRALWRRTRTLVLARHTWTRFVYLLAKFFVGLATFVVVTFLGTLAVVMVATPLLYDDPGTRVQVLRPIVAVVVPIAEQAGVRVGATPTLAVSATPHEVETLPGALATAAAGAVLGVASLHLFNTMARASGWLAVVMLRHEPAD